MSDWDNLLAHLEEQRDAYIKAIDAVKACRPLCENAAQPVCAIDISRAPIFASLLRSATPPERTTP